MTIRRAKKRDTPSGSRRVYRAMHRRFVASVASVASVRRFRLRPFAQTLDTPVHFRTLPSPVPKRSRMSPPSLPSHARVVVIGGGVIGCSVAYHLAHMGCRDVVLLEQHEVTAGTTWHSAGLMVTFGSTSETSTEFRKYTRDLYARLEAETGQATGFKPVGFIEVASDVDRLEEYRRVSAFNRHCGIEVQEISARDVERLFPLARTDDLLAGFYVPQDGRVNPIDVTRALARGARMQGATIIEGCAVTGIAQRGGRVSGVVTPYGTIEAEYVINCGGAWGREIGALAGVSVPLQAAEHYYLITEPIAEVSPTWPVLEDPASYGYYREEGGGLMVGLFEPECAPWRVEGMPADFAFGEIPPDWDRMGGYIETAMRRVPITAETGVRKLFCGPESFTPDLRPILGEAPELRQLLRRGWAQLHRDSHRWWRRTCDGALDPERAPRFRCDGDAYRPAASVSGHAVVPAHAHGRVVRHGVPVPLSLPLDADGAGSEAVAAARTAGGARGVLPRRERMGGGRLVRRRRRRPRSRSAVLRAPGLVRPLA